MLSGMLLSSILMLSGPSVGQPNIWEKIQGKWSYVGEVKEKEQILVLIEKKTKTNNPEILTKDIKRMPFIILSPQGEVLTINPLQ